MSSSSSTSNPPLSVHSVNLPFLGSRVGTHASFQYVLLGVGRTGVTFAIPRWLVSREHFQPGDQVRLHLPLRDGARIFNLGEVTETVRDDALDAQRCLARLTGGEPPGTFPIFAALESGEIVLREADGRPADPTELVRDLLRDLVLRKQGVRVYFDHLVPLFSRITLVSSQEYAELRRVLLSDIRARIGTNIAALEQWEAAVRGEAFTAADLPRVLELEALRTAVEPEINNELFDVTFQDRRIRPYLDAIRRLENQLFLDYNTVVLLYARGL